MVLERKRAVPEKKRTIPLAKSAEMEEKRRGN